MAAPGVLITERELPPPRSAPTDTGTWFVAGLADRGPATPVAVTSLGAFVRRFGPRVAYSLLYDALEVFFREGGSRAYVSRVLGPAALAASIDLSDGTAPTLRVSAASAGAWGNGLSVAVAAGSEGGTFVLIVSDATGELERSPDLADKAAAIAWADNSDRIDASALGGAGDPQVAAAAALTGGTDDRTNATDANWLAALGRFGRDLGPGQVSAPGRTTAAAHADLLAHAAANNRVAVLDAPDSLSAATLRTAAAAVRVNANAKYGAMFAPWARVPGFVAGTTRLVPYSAVQTGLIARSDRRFTQNVAAAGANGQSVYALGLTAAFTEGERESLNEAGVNIARVIDGGVRTYGFRTLVDPVASPTWLEFTHARLRMAVYAGGDRILETFVFRQIDGRGRLFAELAGALTGLLMPLYESGALYGETPEDAFRVETGPAVNTPETIAARQIRAALALRMSQFGEQVILELTKVATSEGLS